MLPISDLLVSNSTSKLLHSLPAFAFSCLSNYFVLTLDASEINKLLVKACYRQKYKAIL